MLDALWQGLRWALGTDVDTLTVWQMALRAVLVYGAALVMVRVGEKRFLGKNTAFDVILGIILGSVVSRAINSTDAILATLVAGFVLVGLHWLAAVIAFHSEHLGSLFKGHSRVLVTDGEIMWDAMRKSHVSERDLRAALRSNARLDDPSEVAVARLERSGEISVLTKEQPPRVVEVSVEAGVQTVRIVLD